MTIACLGWGSLIWRPGDLPHHWRADGPALPIEFARQSRDGRITLVIAADTNPVTVLWTLLDLNSVDGGRNALAEREGCAKTAIGYWSPTASSNLHETDIVGRWAGQKGIMGVVWTALQPKFGDNYRKPSGDEVVQYLAGLTGDAKVVAEEYVRRAPAQIRTVYRDRIERELGWLPTEAE